MDVEILVKRFPRLWHMAEDGSWPAIRKHGLLSTSALLDLYALNGADRREIEESHRPECVVVERAGISPAVIRDQKPMSDAGLRRCLLDGLTPTDWYRILNDMSFFWLTEERLQRLVSAKPYRHLPHTVLTVDTASLVRSHLKKIRLSPMNSGCTKPYPFSRGRSTFSTVADYPYEHWSRKRRGIDPIVELAVISGVPDIRDHIISVHRVQNGEVLDRIL